LHRVRVHGRRLLAEGELEAGLLRDPITLLGATLELSEADQSAMHDEVQQLVDETADRAKSAPTPTLEEIEAYVYAN